jgi:membrane peptidoglycan carboxypeptidase
MGSATDAALELDARWRPESGAFEATRWRVLASGVEARGRLSIAGLGDAPAVDLELEVPRLAFAALLASAALDQRASDLGSAALSLRVKGPLFDPGALVVTQRLDFTPPARALPSIERLRGSFVHRVEPEHGGPIAIPVSPDSPDFVPLDQVPPLFVRALLIAEDANFYGHPGLDLAELPVAFATNLVRGRLARGGSTIPQQLAKNLFLSGTKTVGRKLEEASLALLLDATLGKRRELEIYLNVIEWGPRLYGLRPASRHYFGLEPEQLSPRQIAFLVSLIPGPLKYQRSFPDGVPTAFFEGLMTALLTKLLSVGALTAEEYDAALGAPLGLRLP